MARATTDKRKSPGRRASSGRALVASGKSRLPKEAASARGAGRTATSGSASSKEELRVRVEKLERANATLRIKNKELRLVAVEAAEQVDALTQQLSSSDRRGGRQARHEAPAEAVATREIVRAGRGRRKSRAAEVAAETDDDGDTGAESHRGWSASDHAGA